MSALAAWLAARVLRAVLVALLIALLFDAWESWVVSAPPAVHFPLDHLAPALLLHLRPAAVQLMFVADIAIAVDAAVVESLPADVLSSQSWNRDIFERRGITADSWVAAVGLPGGPGVGFS